MLISAMIAPIILSALDGLRLLVSYIFLSPILSERYNTALCTPGIEGAGETHIFIASELSIIANCLWIKANQYNTITIHDSRKSPRNVIFHDWFNPHFTANSLLNNLKLPFHDSAFFGALFRGFV